MAHLNSVDEFLLLVKYFISVFNVKSLRDVGNKGRKGGAERRAQEGSITLYDVVKPLALELGREQATTLCTFLSKSLMLSLPSWCVPHGRGMLLSGQA